MRVYIKRRWAKCQHAKPEVTIPVMSVHITFIQYNFSVSHSVITFIHRVVILMLSNQSKEFCPFPEIISRSTDRSYKLEHVAMQMSASLTKHIFST